MSQSRCMSLAEAVTNTAVGYLVAVATNHIVLPLFGLPVSLAQSFGIGLVFTVVSTARSYVLRRLFERFRYAKRAQAEAGAFTFDRGESSTEAYPERTEADRWRAAGAA